MVDPFDFSDFGSPRTAGALTSNSTAPGSSGGLITSRATPSDPQLDTGFDPFAETQPRKAESVDAFGTTTPGAASPLDKTLTVARPPLMLFGLAIALAAAGALIAGVWGGALAAAAVGWFLAGPAAIGLLAVYTLVDTRRRTNAVYSAPSWTTAAYWTVVAVCMTGISVGAWHLALWAGRR